MVGDDGLVMVMKHGRSDASPSRKSFASRMLRYLMGRAK